MFKIGDYVQVIDGTVLDNDEKAFGWAGPVTEVFPDTCTIALDAITLNGLSDEYLIECIIDETYADQYTFLSSELKKIEPRNTDREIESARKNLSERMEEMMEQQGFADEYEDELEEETFYSLKTEWLAAYEASEEVKNLPEEEKNDRLFVADSFMDYSFRYEYVLPADWDAQLVKTMCLGVIPTKITADQAFFEAYADRLSLFIRFLEESGHISPAPRIHKMLAKIKHKIPQISGNPENWGPAKSLMMRATEEGVDLSNQAEIDAFIQSYNAQIFSDSPFPAPFPGEDMMPKPFDPKAYDQLSSEWLSDFAKSTYYQNLNSTQQGYARKATDAFMIQIFEGTEYAPKDWTPFDLDMSCLEMAAKLGESKAFFQSMVDHVIGFIQFLGEQGHLPPSLEVDSLQQVKEMVPDIAESPESWEFTKTMMLGAMNEGIDPTDGPALDAYMASMQEELFSSEPPQNFLDNSSIHDPLRKIGRNEKVTVKYPDGRVVDNVKFKKVERDLREGRCELVEDV